MKKLCKAELHCHTRYSDGLGNVETCIRQAQHKQLDILAITDHNTAEGGLPYWDKQPNGLLVIPGEEISTDRGHVIGLFVKETITPGPYEEVIAQLYDQDAIIVIPHPFHIPLANWIRKKEILKFNDHDLEMVHAIEIYNSHNRPKANAMAAEWACQFDKTLVSGSDAHFINEIGNAVTTIEIESFDLKGVKKAFKNKHTEAVTPKRNHFLNYLCVGILNKYRNQNYSYPSKL